MARYRTDRDAGRMAVNLAIHFFWKLDENIMKQIMQLVLSKFGRGGLQKIGQNYGPAFSFAFSSYMYMYCICLLIYF